MRLTPNIITHCTLALFVISFVIFQLPGNSVLSNELQNAGHTLAFAALTFVALIRTAPRRLSGSALLLVGSLLMAAGILIELGQWATGRGFSAMDIAKDLIGIIAGICFYFALVLPDMIKYKLATITTGSLILLSSLSSSLALLVSGELLPQPPILVNFEQWGVAHRIRNSDTVMHVDYHGSEWKTNQTKSASIQYLPGRWPSVQFIEPFSEWRQFECFSFSVYNPQAGSVTIKLRVDDTDLGPNDNDHMTVARVLLPGETNVIIPLEELREQALLGHHPGKPLMRQIRMFMFYISNIDEPVTLLIDDIALGCKD